MARKATIYSLQFSDLPFAHEPHAEYNNRIQDQYTQKTDKHKYLWDSWGIGVRNCGMRFSFLTVHS